MSNPPTPPPPPPRNAPPPPNGGIAKARRKVERSTGPLNDAQRVGVYGPGGIGKTELCSLLTQVEFNPVFLDLEGGTGRLDVNRYEPESWQELRGLIQDPDTTAGCDALVVDTLTAAEELCKQFVVETIPNDKNKRVDSFRRYGWNIGEGHVYDQFIMLLSDLDVVKRRGIHVFCIAHDFVTTAPNPNGDDWLQYEPALQYDKKFSVRHRFRNWLDHLFFVGYDVCVEKGKAESMSRTIYPTQQATCWAKSRMLADPIPYDKGSAEVWRQLFAQGEKT